MKFSVITPNYNGILYLEKTIRAVLEQKKDVDLEYIVVDGGSTDGSVDIIHKYGDEISHCIIEPDSGPANAINKGLQLASGDVISWLNSDDIYFPGTLARVQRSAEDHPDSAMFFGGCVIVDSNGDEIRSSITNFKEFFFPFSSRFTYQCINYLSQPSLFFRRAAVANAGLLREDMVAAWDYDFILRLWHYGTAQWIKGDPLAAFRWYENSISGGNFQIQFREEFDAAKNDAGALSLQAGLHLFVRWGIVSIYSAMSATRSFSRKNKK